MPTKGHELPSTRAKPDHNDRRVRKEPTPWVPTVARKEEKELPPERRPLQLLVSPFLPLACLAMERKTNLVVKVGHLEVVVPLARIRITLTTKREATTRATNPATVVLVVVLVATTLTRKVLDPTATREATAAKALAVKAITAVRIRGATTREGANSVAKGPEVITAERIHDEAAPEVITAERIHDEAAPEVNTAVKIHDAVVPAVTTVEKSRVAVVSAGKDLAVNTATRAVGATTRARKVLVPTATRAAAVAVTLEAVVAAKVVQGVEGLATKKDQVLTVMKAVEVTTVVKKEEALPAVKKGKMAEALGESRRGKSMMHLAILRYRIAVIRLQGFAFYRLCFACCYKL